MQPIAALLSVALSRTASVGGALGVGVGGIVVGTLVGNSVGINVDRSVGTYISPLCGHKKHAAMHGGHKVKYMLCYE
jgi:hypothetical protein